MMGGVCAFLARDDGRQRRAGARGGDRRRAARWPAAADARRRVVRHRRADPGRRRRPRRRELAPPWTALAGHPGVYWTVAMVLLAGSVAAATPVIGLGWRRWGPTPAGHATRREIRRELSLTAARRTAEWTRPGLSAAERARAPLEEVGAPLHRGPTGAMCSPLTSPTGTIAPTQTGKSRGDLVHKGLGAPGALLCSTTKPDLLEFAALTRTRRRMAGPVLVFDATGTTRWPAQLRWSPISGCDDWRSAYQRAHTMVEAAAVHLTEGNSGNDRVFRERATMVVAAYLLAAALLRPRGRRARAVVHRQTALHRAGRPARAALPAAGPEPARRDRHGRPDLGRGVAVGTPGHRAVPGSPLCSSCARRGPGEASTPAPTSPRAGACSSSPASTRPRTPCRS